jgi:lysophospholipase L1-like esterase
VLAGVGEVGFRLLSPAEVRRSVHNLRHDLLTGGMREYEARAYTVFQRVRGAPGCNSLGFVGEEWPRERRPNVMRILCLGGSTTEGGNPQGTKGAYPFLLERELQKRHAREFEVLNAGVSGWTTAEMLVSWCLTLQDYEPDFLILHEAVNDVVPRFWRGFQPDYSHWRRPIQSVPVRGLTRLLVSSSDLFVFAQRKVAPQDILSVSTYPELESDPLLAEGKLPSESAYVFRRNIGTIAEAARVRGADVVLMTLPTGTREVGAFWLHGIAENNQALRDLARERGYALVEAAREFEARPEVGAQFLDLVHLDVPGNQLKAELLADALEERYAANARASAPETK